MTKKDFEAIARCVRQSGEHNAVDDTYREGWHAALSSVTQKLAFECGRDNPRFDRARFLRACGVQS